MLAAPARTNHGKILTKERAAAEGVATNRDRSRWQRTQQQGARICFLFLPSYLGPCNASECYVLHTWLC
eukprot:scaffold56290_cov19-Tisochrysis_lutea.AAC.5